MMGVLKMKIKNINFNIMFSALIFFCGFTSYMGYNNYVRTGCSYIFRVGCPKEGAFAGGPFFYSYFVKIILISSSLFLSQLIEL